MYIRKGLPDRLLSGRINQRLKTDTVQTGFYEGRFFRSFLEHDIANNGTLTIRAEVPVNVVLWKLLLFLHSASIRFESVAGGTASGTWTAMPVIRKNNMTTCPNYEAETVLSFGGTVFGGTIIDSNRAYAQSLPNRLVTVGEQQFEERGASPNNYFFRITNLDANIARINFNIIWEELPCS